MANVKVENNRYTVDSLYQWDLNQVLQIYGLSLPSVPEIHFSNIDMDRAVVRPATMDAAGVITVNVPNSMLQKAGKLKVYICDYEGETFRTLYKLEITVKARVKPYDYTFEDDAGEIYSYKALENAILPAYGNYLEAVEALEESKSNYEAAASKFNAAASKFNAAEKLVGAVETILTNSADSPGCYNITVDGETEWLNPPMRNGGTYRTMERFYGKPVYVAVRQFGFSAAASATGAIDCTWFSSFIGDTGTLVRYEILMGKLTNNDIMSPLPNEYIDSIIVHADGSATANVLKTIPSNTIFYCRIYYIKSRVIT